MPYKPPEVDVDVRREFDAVRINAILNDPVVRPWVADLGEGVLDISSTVANHRNVLLMGEYGGCMFFRIALGVYEVHTQVLPSGRGKWTRGLTSACAHWMFTHTDAMEILTRVPARHIAARAAAENAGMVYEFTRGDGCRWRGEEMPVDVYAMRIVDWAKTAPGLVEAGRSFHCRLQDEAVRLGVRTPPHADDENHNRYVGATFDMFVAGQRHKAVWWYNRWAMVSRHEPIELVETVPPAIRCDIGLVRLVDGGRDIEVVLE